MKEETLIKKMMETSAEIFEDFFGIAPTELEQSNYLDPDDKYEMSVFNSISGDVKASFLIRFTKATADKIQLAFKNTEKEDLCNLGNSIISQIREKVSKMNIDFSESAIAVGTDLKFAFNSKSKIRTTRLDLPGFGVFNIVIAYKAD